MVCAGWPLAIGGVITLRSLGDIPLCAFRQLTGIPCPLCGGTHTCAALLQGDFVTAWQANPGVLFLVAVAMMHSALLAAEAASGRQIKRPLVPKTLSWAWFGALVVLLAAWLWRLLGQI